jgi:hypothetical protein
VDATQLDVALRKRLSGLDNKTAAAKLAEDRELLERWLKSSVSADHPAYWVLGFLTLPGLAGKLIRPVPPAPKGPTIHFEAPTGCKTKPVPFALNLKFGKIVGVITAIDEIAFELMGSKYKNWRTVPGLTASWASQEIRLDQVEGHKHIYRQTAPAPWKRVEYDLRVPGGFVSVMLDGMGADFDEAEFESKLHTIRLASDI